MTEEDNGRGRRANAARRQREALSSLRSSSDARHWLLEELQLRRHGTEYPLFELHLVDRPDSGGQVEVLQVPSELLAHTEDLDDRARKVVARAGFTATPVDGLRGRVTTLRASDPKGAGNEVLRRRLDRIGVRSSVSYLAPNKVVMKSTATPERPRDVTPPAAPTSNGGGGGGDPVVVVLDTGVHQRNRTDGWLHGLERPDNVDALDVFPKPNGKLDFAAGHGSFVAGVIQQVDADLDLRVERVSDSDGFAHEVDVAVAMVGAVDRALEEGGQVVLNLSLGAETADDQPPVALSVAMDILRQIEADRGGELLVVAAAGNEGGQVRCWPAAFAQDHPESVVAVGALGTDGRPAKWSSHGPWVTCSAIGEAVLSTFVKGKEDPDIDPEADEFPANAWAYWSGSSFATPKVTAAIASAARRGGCSLDDARRQVLGAGRHEPRSPYGTSLAQLG